MSFQGDVRGIGLAELLQGLARGQKEGVLTLTSHGNQRAVLGMEDGKAWLLPDPDENQESWRTRARNAWADDATFTISAERLQPIVKAGRLETLYALLDGGGVHFRFDPGELPGRITRLEEEGHPVTEIHCDPTQVEFLLLEYARMADELEMAGHPKLVPGDAIPCVSDQDELASLPPSLVQQIDGNSTILEISDRLGWPLRQTQLAVLGGLNRGGFRLAHPIETLRLALHELQRKAFARASSRLELWCRTGSPGPLVPEDAEALTNEWLAGRLTAALRLMKLKNVRCLLRRLDASLGSTGHAVVHWTEAVRIAPSDRIARLRLTAMQLRDGGEGCGLDAREVLDLARELREHGTPMRSGPAFAIAAYLQPGAIPQRLELGTGLLNAGRAEEAGPWIVSACTDMLAQGHADRILGPLRGLIEGDARNREARELLTRAKRQSTKSKKFRRNLAIAASGIVLIGSGAVVKVKLDEQRTDKIRSIRAMLAEPEQGLAQLDAQFQGDTSLEIGDLRRELEDRLRTVEMAQRAAWLDLYHDAQKEAMEGDLLTALDRIRALPTPPRLRLVTEAWPARMDLFMAMPNRLNEEVISLGYPSTNSPRQVRVEERVRADVDALTAALDTKELASNELNEFREALDAITELVIEREQKRSEARFEADREETLAKNDRLLKLAHGALANNQFARALKHYEEILANDTTGKVRRVLRDEIADVRKKHEAVLKARAAAERGDHPRALEILDATFEESVPVMLPFRVETLPAGVHVSIRKLDASGEPGETVVRDTPFTMEGTFLDEWILEFTLDDFDPRALQVEGPQDLSLDLSRTPAARFETSGRVDAIPAPLGDGTTGDYIVCDRNGGVQRITWDGSVRWRQDIATVNGIARRPVALPGREGAFLLLTETGSVWLVDPTNGDTEGPLELGEPPVFGPVIIGNEVRAQLRSGRIARWRTSLMPKFDEAAAGQALDESLRHGFEGLFTVLRPDGTDSPSLRTSTADGGGWTVAVEEHRFVVTHDDENREPYTIRRTGRWTYLAWEAPSSPDEPPILWISDGIGLRAFLPPGAERRLSGAGGLDLEGPPGPEDTRPAIPVETICDEPAGPPADGPPPPEELPGPPPLRGDQ